MGVKRLRHPPGGWKNLTNDNFGRTRFVDSCCACIPVWSNASAISEFINVGDGRSTRKAL
ncbi:MAG: hypothetical protein MPJ50_13490, partial [Pirellulales bacterium]|nr:hypothetical protein [Pirellulales bacterium]